VKRPWLNVTRQVTFPRIAPDELQGQFRQVHQELRVCPPVGTKELNALFASVWPDHPSGDMQPILERALVYVCAYDEGKLIGFAKVVGDGGIHGFLLDPMVAPKWQRKGIGKRLVQACIEESRRKGVQWLHVDFEPHLRHFYTACGFSSTNAGLLRLDQQSTS
jgi:GNAT superfamily N-acetyltransferase